MIVYLSGGLQRQACICMENHKVVQSMILYVSGGHNCKLTQAGIYMGNHKRNVHV